MDRRRLLKGTFGLPLATGLSAPIRALAVDPGPARRIRPSDAAWPDVGKWKQLARAVRGNLVRPTTIWAACADHAGSAACLAGLQDIHNPFALGDNPGGTQVAGWLDAWTAQASAYAVAARSTHDVVAAVNFAREHNLRLVVKGGGHSYLGGSNAPDSLLIWTRSMNRLELNNAFVAKGCPDKPVPAVTLDAGCMWIDAYSAVTTQAGRYVQGGGCTSVGVAGLIQGGGFGSFSKRWGLAAGSLLEAEIVTADGVARTVNACREPDLFWALKGGGGGSFGVVTRLTLQTYELPARFGGADAEIKAASAEAFRRLLDKFFEHYASTLFNPHWGEQIHIQPDHVLNISMVCQGLDTVQAREAWARFFDWVSASPADFRFTDGPAVETREARSWWSLAKNAAMVLDKRPHAAPGHAWWHGDQDQVSMFLHGFDSFWMPQSLLAPEHRSKLVDSLIAASREVEVQLHFNKGLAGAPQEEIAVARACAVNPAVTEAFCLAIVATGGLPPFPGLPGKKGDMMQARVDASNVAEAAAILHRIAPAGSYLSETDFFRPDWREAFWGANYARLKKLKDRYDPDGFFFVHHGVGSEDWSSDGFTRIAPT